MTCKPNAKPLVSGWLNPLANGRLTIKQNKTKQDEVGFGSLNQNQNPPYLLVSQLYKQGFFSCFFSCGLVLCGSFERQKNDFPQVFNRVFNNGTKWG